MDDLANKVAEILSNPESLNKLKSLSGLFGGNSNESSEKKPSGEKLSDNETSSTKKNDVPDIPIDAMNTMMKVMPIISSMNKEDNNTRFLLALKPLLSKDKQKKIDQSIRMIQMMKIMPILKNKELFV